MARRKSPLRPYYVYAGRQPAHVILLPPGASWPRRSRWPRALCGEPIPPDWERNGTFSHRPLCKTCAARAPVFIQVRITPHPHCEHAAKLQAHCRYYGNLAACTHTWGISLPAPGTNGKDRRRAWAKARYTTVQQGRLLLQRALALPHVLPRNARGEIPVHIAVEISEEVPLLERLAALVRTELDPKKGAMAAEVYKKARRKLAKARAETQAR